MTDVIIRAIPANEMAFKTGPWLMAQINQQGRNDEKKSSAFPPRFIYSPLRLDLP